MPWIVTISVRCSCPLLYVYTCTSIGQLTSLSCIDVGCTGDAVQMDGCLVVGGCTCVECTTSVGMGTGKGRVGTVYWDWKGEGRYSVLELAGRRNYTTFITV